MKSAHHALPLLIMLVLPGAPAGAVQVAELEQAIADRLAERRVPGEMVWLEASGSSFLGLFLDAPSAEPRRAVLLLHGLGAHPDWPEVIQPVRTRLPEMGWPTLSIQLPRLSPQASHADETQLPRRAMPRIQAAVTFLAGRGIESIAIVGYGFGAALGAQFLGSRVKGVVAFAAISLQIPGHLALAVKYPESLEAIKVPVLDVQAARDDVLVLQQAPERELWGRKSKTRSFDRMTLPDADAGYHGREDELALAIADWLNVNSRAATMPTPRVPAPAPTDARAAR